MVYMDIPTHPRSPTPLDREVKPFDLRMWVNDLCARVIVMCGLSLIPKTQETWPNCEEHLGLDRTVPAS